MEPISAIVAFITNNPTAFTNLTGLQATDFFKTPGNWFLRNANEVLEPNAKSYTGWFGTFDTDFEIIDPFTGATSLARINNFDAIQDAKCFDQTQGEISCMMVHRKSNNQWELSAYSVRRV